MRGLWVLFLLLFISVGWTSRYSVSPPPQEKEKREEREQGTFLGRIGKVKVYKTKSGKIEFVKEEVDDKQGGAE